MMDTEKNSPIPQIVPQKEDSAGKPAPNRLLATLEGDIPPTPVASREEPKSASIKWVVPVLLVAVLAAGLIGWWMMPDEPYAQSSHKSDDPSSATVAVAPVISETQGRVTTNVEIVREEAPETKVAAAPAPAPKSNAPRVETLKERPIKTVNLDENGKEVAPASPPVTASATPSKAPQPANAAQTPTPPRAQVSPPVPAPAQVPIRQTENRVASTEKAAPSHDADRAMLVTLLDAMYQGERIEQLAQCDALPASNRNACRRKICADLWGKVPECPANRRFPQ